MRRVEEGRRAVVHVGKVKVSQRGHALGLGHDAVPLIVLVIVFEGGVFRQRENPSTVRRESLAVVDALQGEWTAALQPHEHGP